MQQHLLFKEPLDTSKSSEEIDTYSKVDRMNGVFDHTNLLSDTDKYRLLTCVLSRTSLPRSFQRALKRLNLTKSGVKYPLKDQSNSLMMITTMLYK